MARTKARSSRVQLVTATVGDPTHPETVEAEALTIEDDGRETTITLEDGRTYRIDSREMRGALLPLVA